MKYAIEVRETLSRIIAVKANDEIEADEKVRTAYRNGEIVLDCEDFMDVEFIDNTECYDEETMNLFDTLPEED